MKSILLILAAGLSLGFLSGCSKDKDKPRTPSPEAWFWQSSPIQQSNSVQVVDMDGKPVAGAQILIGYELPNAVVSELLTTDESGHFLVPETWTQPEIITISANGYVRATYMNQTPQGQILRIRKNEMDQKVELKGKGQGFTTKDRDGLIDFGLIIGAFTKTELFGFDLTMVLSPEMDTISAAGQKMLVPSNISLPKQKESYIIPITIQKEVYRKYFKAPGDKMIYAIRGQFPFKKLIEEMRAGKDFFQVINLFKLTGGAIREVELTPGSNALDIPVNELSFNQTKNYLIPNVGSDESLIVIAASQYKNHLLPTDIKTIDTRGQIPLTVASGSEPTAITVLKKKDDKNLAGALSVSLVPFKNKETTLIPLMPEPILASAYDVKIQTVVAPSEVRPLATYSVLMSVEKKRSGDMEYEVTTKKWEVYSSGWLDGFSLPQWPAEGKITGQNRWEVSLVGRQDDLGIRLGPDLLETATHATRNSVDF